MHINQVGGKGFEISTHHKEHQEHVYDYRNMVTQSQGNGWQDQTKWCIHNKT
jgi:hypothetical protein